MRIGHSPTAPPLGGLLDSCPETLVRYDVLCMRIDVGTWLSHQVCSPLALGLSLRTTVASEKNRPDDGFDRFVEV